MGRKVVALNVETLDLLPAPCRQCVFWELGPKARPLGSEEAGLQKEAWLSSIVLEWGAAGHVLLVDGAPAAYSLYAPARFLEQATSQAARPVSRDAVLLATLAVWPPFEGQGIGRALLQAMARDSVLPHPDRLPGGVWLPGSAGAPALSPATHGSPYRPAMEGCA